MPIVGERNINKFFTRPTSFDNLVLNARDALLEVADDRERVITMQEDE